MLINEVLDSKSIALSATENASNQIPYLGLQWFPERKKQGLDLSWIKTHKGLPVSLAPSNFDTIPTIRAKYAMVMKRPIKELAIYEIEDIDKENCKYFSTEEKAKARLKELRGGEDV